MPSSNSCFRATISSCTIPQTSVADFVARVLPPLPPLFGERETAVAKVMEKLQINGVLKAEYKEDGTTSYTWSPMEKQPATITGMKEKQVFKALELIVTGITTAVDKCFSVPGQEPELQFQYMTAGDSTPESNHRRSNNKSRPDGYFFPRGSQLSGGRKVHRWWDIGFVGEFKKEDTKKDMHDDAQKVLWGLNTIMREDPRRRFAYGFTIENTTTRFWFCDRSQIISTQPFSFFEQPHFLVSFFLSALYADETAQGWDPTIVRVRVAQPVRMGAKPKFKYQYDITVHSVDKNGRIKNVVYRTESLLSQVAADELGRGSRVWTARRIATGTVRKSPKETAPLVVIKDYWVEPDRKREGDIVNQLRQRASEEIEADEEKEAFLEHIPSIVHHGDVLISGSHDQTRSFRDIFKKDREGKIVTFDLIAGIRSSRLPTDEGTSTYLTPSSFVDPPLKHGISLLDIKTHYRIVFKDYGEPLHKATLCLGAQRAVLEAMECLALLHSLGWVHRDISAGNILLVHDGPDEVRGLLADFEYATEYGAEESSHTTRTGTEYFMSIEVDDHEYLFMPKGPSTAKFTPKSDAGQQKLRFGGLLKMKKDNVQPLTQDPPPPLPFRYHPLNDWESIWWVAVYMVVNRVVEPCDDSNLERLDTQREIARQLFYTGSGRKHFFRPNFSALDNKLKSALDPRMQKIMTHLNGIRFDLHHAYTEVEADPTRYPDAERSLELITPSVFTNMNLICDYLQQEPQSALRIQPIPPKSSGKSVGEGEDAAVGVNADQDEDEDEE
ncbi:hypothetical protein PYCCODRAFT_1431118 [Trametes coccinea BRFM310]|uniref:Protein kinase domain-containing protein n=1 Tax=Trametes coccinea (strain BRFM310) TaxID=1353009 RepID=A0A1Y2J1Z1_TRAC3|nr:hypothetical protein PYCCODRAFT_1431118 [Trametes coccinea BRFM310]